MFEKKYSDDDISTLIEMWKDGYTASVIAEELDKSTQSVRQFLYRNRQRYGFEKRQSGNPFVQTAFDKQWYGAVPFGHWTITKPWSKA